MLDLTIGPLKLTLEVQRQRVQHIQIDGCSRRQGLNGGGPHQLHLPLLILYRGQIWLLSTMICIMDQPV